MKRILSTLIFGSTMLLGLSANAITCPHMAMAVNDVNAAIPWLQGQPQTIEALQMASSLIQSGMDYASCENYGRSDDDGRSAQDLVSAALDHLNSTARPFGGYRPQAVVALEGAVAAINQAQSAPSQTQPQAPQALPLQCTRGYLLLPAVGGLWFGTNNDVCQPIPGGIYCHGVDNSESVSRPYTKTLYGGVNGPFTGDDGNFCFR